MEVRLYYERFNITMDIHESYACTRGRMTLLILQYIG